MVKNFRNQSETSSCKRIWNPKPTLTPALSLGERGLKNYNFMQKELVKKILSETESGYDLIAEKFSQTRNRFWKELEFIGEFVKEGDNVLDFGCGNGRLLELFKNKKIKYAGADVSEKLIQKADANKSSFEKTEASFLKIENDFKKLPFGENYFDAVYSIAVFHHIPGSEKRLEIACELYRLAKKNSFIVITVWNLWQPRYRKNVFANWKNKILGKSELDWNDCWITFTDNQGQVFKRFHHAFTIIDLKKLFGKAGFKIIRCEKIKGNLVLVGKK